MQNKKGVLFLVFLFLYVVGVCIGSARQVLASDQTGMYEYLESAMSGYNVTASESVRSIFTDNMKLFLWIAVGGFFLLGPVIMGGVVLIKGYSTGFAITAVLRLFGIYGMTFCIANLLSACLVVPMLCWYSSNSVVNIQERRYERREFLKHFFVLLAVMLVVMTIDSGVRGFLSAVLMKFAPKV